MSKTIKKTRIFVLEDNDLTRQMVKALLMKVRYFDVVGEAATGELAVATAALCRPDVILADIGLPGIDGIETVRRLRQANPGTKAIMLTAHDNDDDLFQSFKAGAEGYILKTGMSGKRLELAIKSVEQGSVWLDPLIAARVLTAAVANRGVQTPSLVVEPLSGEEISVLEKVADAPQCEYGVCNVDPNFLAKLRRFSSKEAFSPPVYEPARDAEASMWM